MALALVAVAGVGCQKKEGVDPTPPTPGEPAAAFEPRVIYTLEFHPEPGREISDEDKETTLINLRERLSIDLEKVRVTREGEDRVLVSIGDEVSTEELEPALTMSAKLSFQMAHPTHREYVGVTDPAEVIVPGGTLVPYREVDEVTGERQYLLVGDKVEIRGDHVKRAQAVKDPGRWSILLNLDKEGGERLYELSKAHNIRGAGPSGLPFAIILDGEILSAPVFTEPIAGGIAQISGSFDETEARRLASAMQTPLAIPLRILFKSGAAGAADEPGEE